VGSARGPSREKTVLGVGVAAAGNASEAAVAPVVVLAPKRERTVLGVAPGPAPAGPQAPRREISLQEPPPPEGWDLPEPAPPEPERSIPLDLVPGRRTGAAAEAPPAPAPTRDPSVAVDLSELDSNAKEPSLVAAGLPRHRGRKLLVLLAVVAAAGAVGYVQRAHLRPLLNQLPLKALQR
jgi:hypothetical protein